MQNVLKVGYIDWWIKDRPVKYADKMWWVKNKKNRIFCCCSCPAMMTGSQDMVARTFSFRSLQNSGAKRVLFRSCSQCSKFLCSDWGLHSLERFFSKWL
jgi:hypothetical protein